eukprot:CAMPEP_0113942782 /NCGR_PEP_ID=MMETSP1339-20121228/9558_1 /TAXON_ID=94617 /ORGANISM="Fibrocapsa japonica" /LENGTH=49 /DNA_ID=CAMNT_0000947391 /DNA_START=1 /DNA_END=150 /DNA_ORIENTATION=- /assembly_acc=CAM_ASM_000762
MDPTLTKTQMDPDIIVILKVKVITKLLGPAVIQEDKYTSKLYTWKLCTT